MDFHNGDTCCCCCCSDCIGIKLLTFFIHLLTVLFSTIALLLLPKKSLLMYANVRCEIYPIINAISIFIIQWKLAT
jgi:hypothetical protein